MSDTALQELVEALLAEVRALKFEKRLPMVLTRKHAAQELDISLSKLKGMIRDGKIMVCEVGDSDGIPASEIRRIASSMTTRTGKPPPRPARQRKPRYNAAEEAAKARAALRKKT